MLIRRLLELGVSQPKLLVPSVLFAHTNTCPAVKKQVSCADAYKKKADGGAAGGAGGTGLKRALKPGKCRLGFIPDEWFLFLRPMTGVSGPYILMLGLANYLVSKEIYVMEHEYYLGVSIVIVLYLITTRLGPSVGKALDKEVNAIANEYKKGRHAELSLYNTVVKDAETAKWRAEGQKDLMDAKKENIAMQLEAIYRDRAMIIYQRVKGRMDYHVRRHRTEGRIHQKWMINWILENVHKSITPEFKQQALNSAIQDLAALASRAK